jgi:hypothetical protein
MARNHRGVPLRRTGVERTAHGFPEKIPQAPEIFSKYLPDDDSQWPNVALSFGIRWEILLRIMRRMRC